MERNDWDKLLRDRLEGVTETAPDVWEGISKGLDRRRRLVVFRRFAVAATAAAAGLAVALTVFHGPRTGETAVPALTAHYAGSPAAPAEEGTIAPIEEQIAAFTRSQAVAVANVTRPAAATAVEAAAEAAPSAEEAAAAETPAEDAPAEGTPVEAAPVEENPVVETLGQLTQDDLPAGYWDAEETTSHRTHTSHISILSNMTTVASEGTIFYNPSAMHVSSQSGKGQATSQVEPLATTPKFYAPLTFGLQAGISLTDRLSVETGVTYSYLVSQYDMLVDKVLFSGAYNQLHYVGVPLRMSYHFVQTDHFGAYASLGGAVEKCVSQRYVYGSNTLHEKVGGVQWSTGIGVGVEYWFVPRLGIYFDPSLVYFFDNSQPLSIRTQQPLQAKFEVGFRFKL